MLELSKTIILAYILYFLPTSELTWNKHFEMLFRKHRNPPPGTADPGHSLDIQYCMGVKLGSLH